MKPNIDRKGRIARAACGALCVAGGVACGLTAWPESTVWRWTTIISLGAFGAFQLYEAKKSWCIMRALGVKTPM